jgi:hypothetical protein
MFDATEAGFQPRGSVLYEKKTQAYLDILPALQDEDSRSDSQTTESTAPRVRRCGLVVCHVPGSWADEDGLVFFQANRLTAGCAKQPLLQETPIVPGRYLLRMLIAPFTSAWIVAPQFLHT